MRQVACIVLLIGCTSSEPTFHAFPAVAVGSTATAGVTVYDHCKPGPDDSASCVLTTIPIDSATIDDLSVFSLESKGPNYVYTALAEGTANLTVIADGETYHRQLRAAVPDTIEVDIDCRGGAIGDAPTTGNAFGTSSELGATYKMFVGGDGLYGVALFHDTSVIPIESPLLTVKAPPDVVGKGHVIYATGTSRASGAITSPFDPELSIPFVVFEAADVTGFKLTQLGFGLASGETTSLNSYLTIGNGEPTCVEHFARTVTTLTPATCMLWDRTQTQTTLVVSGRDQFSVKGVAAGMCTIEITLDGTTTTTTQSWVLQS